VQYPILHHRNALLLVVYVHISPGLILREKHSVGFLAIAACMSGLCLVHVKPCQACQGHWISDLQSHWLESISRNSEIMSGFYEGGGEVIRDKRYFLRKYMIYIIVLYEMCELQVSSY
jgi:hypothetical protein